MISFIVLFPFIAGLFLYICPGEKGNRKVLNISAAVAALIELAACIYTVSPVIMGCLAGNTNTVISSYIPRICGFGLNFCVDGFRAVYAIIAGFMWAMVSILSGEYFNHHKNVARFYNFLLLTEGATLGVFLSADLMTTFIFFEIMSFTSYVWVAQEENRPSLRAAETYLAVAVMGGLSMLMGIFMVYNQLGTLNILEITGSGRDNKVIFAAGICMLVGFGAKAGAFPLHIWLPKAHPVAPAPASALLSGILTKTGIYGVLILSCRVFFGYSAWGRLILILGVITMFGGAFLALFSIDLKRTLACSSMSQIGFIMVGIGMQVILGEEGQLAVFGTFLHMINHSLIKLVLFMLAGVIYFNLHKLDLNQIRGFGRNKNLIKIMFLIGALAIGGIPGFSGYISKTLLHEGIVEAGGGAFYTTVEWIFLISGGMTVAYMTKLFVAIFVEKNKDEDVQIGFEEKSAYISAPSAVAVGLSTLVLFVLGVFPQKLMMQIARFSEFFCNAEFEEYHQVHFFAFENLKGGLISISIGVVLYFVVIRLLLMKDGKYVNRWPEWLDLENMLYRPLLLSIIPLILGVVFRVFDSLVDGIVVLLRKTIYKDSPLPHDRLAGSAMTDFFGRIANHFQKVANKTYRRNKPVNRDYIRIFAMRSIGIKETNTIIRRSLSFGLFLVCLGIVCVFVYMI